MKKSTGWMMSIVEDEEDDMLAELRERERLSTVGLEKLRESNSAEMPKLERYGFTIIKVLPELCGRPWNNAAANFLACLRPSCVRVSVMGGWVTSDARMWRVTVYLNEDTPPVIQRIEQEVEVGLVGFRNGQDANHYLAGHDDALDGPQPTTIINSRAINHVLDNMKL